MQEASLYNRLGGIFAIAAVVDHFSDAIMKNAMVGKLSKKRAAPPVERRPAAALARSQVHAHPLGRQISPVVRFEYTPTKPGGTPLGLEEAHRDLKISPDEFDEVAAELKRTLDAFKVPEPEQGQVLGAFAAHKDEVTEGYRIASPLALSSLR